MPYPNHQRVRRLRHPGLPTAAFPPRHGPASSRRPCPAVDPPRRGPLPAGAARARRPPMKRKGATDLATGVAARARHSAHLPHGRAAAAWMSWRPRSRPATTTEEVGRLPKSLIVSAVGVAERLREKGQMFMFSSGRTTPVRDGHTKLCCKAMQFGVGPDSRASFLIVMHDLLS